MAYRTAFPQQWHLKPTTVNGHLINAHASVEEAWQTTRGEGSIIAVIDDGVDIDHEEFMSSGKIIERKPIDPMRITGFNPSSGQNNHHNHNHKILIFQ